MTTTTASTAATNSVAATSVLVITQQRTEEMQPAFAAISRHFPDGDVRVLSDIDAAARSIEQDRWFPDLVIVCQHWPGEFTSAETHFLLGLLPLARWVCIRGSWCESDGRNGTPWPDAISVRARAAAPRIELERRVLDGLIVALPLTASRDEIFEFEHQRPNEKSPRVGSDVPQTVAIISSDRELCRLLGDLLTTGGFSVVAFPPTETSLAVIVWDIDPISPARYADIQQLRDTYSPSVIVAISNMAYPEDMKAFSACGVNGVVAKSNLAEMLTTAIATHLQDL